LRSVVLALSSSFEEEGAFFTLGRLAALSLRGESFLRWVFLPSPLRKKGRGLFCVGSFWVLWVCPLLFV
jgi:hypothetical protein